MMLQHKPESKLITWDRVCFRLEELESSWFSTDFQQQPRCTVLYLEIRSGFKILSLSLLSTLLDDPASFFNPSAWLNKNNFMKPKKCHPADTIIQFFPQNILSLSFTLKGGVCNFHTTYVAIKKTGSRKTGRFYDINLLRCLLAHAVCVVPLVTG